MAVHSLAGPGMTTTPTSQKNAPSQKRPEPNKSGWHTRSPTFSCSNKSKQSRPGPARRKVLRSQELPAARSCGRQEKCYGSTARNWVAKKSVATAWRATGWRRKVLRRHGAQIVEKPCFEYTFSPPLLPLLLLQGLLPDLGRPCRDRRPTEGCSLLRSR